jgi:DNA invertase Pin-like site-specific DNA recombinase
MKTHQPGKAYGYCRASTEEQETTLDAQEDGIRHIFEAKYKEQGYTFKACFIDRGISGGIPLMQRAAGYRMCLLLEPGDLVLMQKIDRGWRSVKDFANSLDIWKARGVRVAFVTMDIDTGSPSGMMQAQMLTVFSEFERGMMGERMRHFNAKRKAAGLPYAGFAPHGYKLAGPKKARRFEPFPEMRVFAGLLLEWHNKGWGYQQIAKHCAKIKLVHPATGRPPTTTTVYNLCLREAEAQARESR